MYFDEQMCGGAHRSYEFYNFCFTLDNPLLKKVCPNIITFQMKLNK